MTDTQRRTASLADLGLTAKGGRKPEITGLALDSRAVRPGHLFAALPGARVHGGEFISYAIRMGAAAVLTDAEGARRAADVLKDWDGAVVVADDARAALAGAAALWYGAQPETMVAVTGTNGKTSVASFTRQLFQGLGLRAANIGTTGIEGDYQGATGHTTPDTLTLHRLLADMAGQGVTHAAMEASSHGLDQRRLDGVRLAAAGFTNFSQDHLDYHGTMHAYFEAKMGLFTRLLPPDGWAVVNLDDPKGPMVAEIAYDAGVSVLGTGRRSEADLRLLGQRFDATGQEMRFDFAGQTFQTRLELIGGFQADNVLVALGLLLALGIDIEELVPLLPKLTTVRGRMERAGARANGASVFVDYAHTPDALVTACRAIRPHVLGRLVLVFGAGGDRDRGKRPLMGAAARENADVVFVTDDNPRSEDPALIRAAIRAEVPDATEVPDRAEAILRGVDALGPGDVLLIAGKGHESGQIVGDTVYPFDDVEQASVAIAALDGRLP
jgi:UDP-N-acetylmuramoyl-L-alanyl-D-glutamate--2,6-diaminopimelate ligase